jgi:hypothetical protein
VCRRIWKLWAEVIAHCSRRLCSYKYLSSRRIWRAGVALLPRSVTTNLVCGWSPIPLYALRRSRKCLEISWGMHTPRLWASSSFYWYRRSWLGFRSCHDTVEREWRETASMVGIWELDTFASAVKGCPAAIDWSHNKTPLPIKYEFWFSHKYQRSCFLATRTIDRWKVLRESGNESLKASYIVVNSLLCNAQSLPSQGPKPAVPLSFNLTSSTAKCSGGSSEKMEISEKLAIKVMS